MQEPPFAAIAPSSTREYWFCQAPVFDRGTVDSQTSPSHPGPIRSPRRPSCRGRESHPGCRPDTTGSAGVWAIQPRCQRRNTPRCPDRAAVGSCRQASGRRMNLCLPPRGRQIPACAQTGSARPEPRQRPPRSSHIRRLVDRDGPLRIIRGTCMRGPAWTLPRNTSRCVAASVSTPTPNSVPRSTTIAEGV